METAKVSMAALGDPDAEPGVPQAVTGPHPGEPTMRDQKPVFETDEVAASRGREQGLGIGARELAAQRDPGDVQSRDDEDVHVEPDDEALKTSDDA